MPNIPQIRGKTVVTLRFLKIPTVVCCCCWRGGVVAVPWCWCAAVSRLPVIFLTLHAFLSYTVYSYRFFVLYRNNACGMNGKCRRWVPFTSSARSDGATFEHWQKEKEEKDSADYAYARWVRGDRHVFCCGHACDRPCTFPVSTTRFKGGLKYFLVPSFFAHRPCRCFLLCPGGAFCKTNAEFRVVETSSSCWVLGLCGETLNAASIQHDKCLLVFLLYCTRW